MEVWSGKLIRILDKVHFTYYLKTLNGGSIQKVIYLNLLVGNQRKALGKFDEPHNQCQ